MEGELEEDSEPIHELFAEYVKQDFIDLDQEDPESISPEI